MPGLIFLLCSIVDWKQLGQSQSTQLHSQVLQPWDLGHIFCLPQFPQFALSCAESTFHILEIYKLLGAVAQDCNPSTLGGRGGWIMRSKDRDQPGQHDETPSLLKIQKLAGMVLTCSLSYLWAEKLESLEPGRWRLQ